ncbi:MAG: hypothetical protein FJ295_02260 [Planctomycetes bacterium]|nr:hypothetical protein [Planctomycetota bacterium]
MASDRSAPQRESTMGEIRRLLDQPIYMLSFLFLAALFLGFPFLWSSRAFRLHGKIIITLLVLIETVLIFWGFGLVMQWVWHRFHEF